MRYSSESIFLTIGRCPEQDDFMLYYALKINYLQMSKNFVLGKVSLKFQLNYFQYQRYKN